MRRNHRLIGTALLHLSLLAGILTSFPASAQRPGSSSPGGDNPPAALTLQERYHINALMLSTLSEYQLLAPMVSYSDRLALVRLFEHAASPSVFCDIAGTPTYQSMVTPKEYVELVDTDGGSFLSINMSRIRKKGDFVLVDGKWHRHVTMEKELLYIDASTYKGGAGGVFFDAATLYGDRRTPFQLDFDLVYDPAEDRCLISSITAPGSRPSSVLDNGFVYVVLNPNDEVFDHLNYNGGALSYNEYGQTMITDLNALSFDSDDYKLLINTEASSSVYDVLSLGFKRLHHYRIKPHYDMTLGNAFYPGSYPDKVNFAHSSKASEVRLDLGLLFVTRPKSHFGLYVGAGYSQSQICLEASDFEYDFMPGVTYSIGKASETLGFTDIVFPLYLEKEWKIGSRLHTTFDFGAKLYLNIDNQMLEAYTVSGIQNNRDFLLDSRETGFHQPQSFAKEPLDVSLFAGLSLDARIIGPVYGFLSLGYEFGLPFFMPAYKPETLTEYYAPDLMNPIFPVEYTVGNDQLYRSMVGSVDFTRRSLWLSVGLNFKLNL